MSEFPLMGVEIFEGGNGHLVIVQEWPDLKGESYLRVMMNMDEAESICARIMAVAEKARRK